jgi:hypothetical protein
MLSDDNIISNKPHGEGEQQTVSQIDENEIRQTLGPNLFRYIYI